MALPRHLAGVNDAIAVAVAVTRDLGIAVQESVSLRNVRPGFFKDAKIVEEWSIIDIASMMRQLGKKPSSGNQA